MRRDSDGTVKAAHIAVPVFGYKNHVSTDRRHGLIRSWTLSDAAAHDGRFLRELVDLENTAAPVWADTAYRSARNAAFLARHGRVSKVQFRRQPGKPLSVPQSKANAARARVRGHIEHVFGAQKGPMALVVRTLGLARAKTKIGLANLACNFRRLVWLDSRSAPA